MPTSLRLCLATVAAVALAVIAGVLGRRLAFESPTGPRAFEVLLVDVAEYAAFGACAWLCLATTVAVVAATRDGGSLSAAIAARITPQILARLIGVAVGGAVGLAPVAASAAADELPPSGPGVVGLRLPDRPTDSIGPATRARRTEVIVRRGDSLWQIAAAHLPVDADNATIAASCARWYAANRAAVGPDQDLLLPGTRLIAPTTDRERNR